jgi:hypothetical protein
MIALGVRGGERPGRCAAPVLTGGDASALGGAWSLSWARAPLILFGVLIAARASRQTAELGRW